QEPPAAQLALQYAPQRHANRESDQDAQLLPTEKEEGELRRNRPGDQPPQIAPGGDASSAEVHTDEEREQRPRHATHRAETLDVGEQDDADVVDDHRDDRQPLRRVLQGAQTVKTVSPPPSRRRPRRSCPSN